MQSGAQNSQGVWLASARWEANQQFPVSFDKIVAKLSIIFAFSVDSSKLQYRKISWGIGWKPLLSETIELPAQLKTESARSSPMTTSLSSAQKMVKRPLKAQQKQHLERLVKNKTIFPEGRSQRKSGGTKLKSTAYIRGNKWGWKDRNRSKILKMKLLWRENKQAMASKALGSKALWSKAIRSKATRTEWWRVLR